MAVHPNSVISTNISNFSQNMYDKLTDMENYCYENSDREDQLDGSISYDNMEDVYKPYFQSLSDGIESWFNASFNEEALFDLMQGMYTFIHLNTMYDYRNDLKNDLDASYVFDMGGYIEDLDGYAISYYDDVVITQEENPDTGMMEDNVTASNLEADIARFTPIIDETTGESSPPPAVASTNNKISSLQGQIQSAVQKKINRLLYEDEEIQDTIRKDQMYQAVFVDYGYDFYIDFLGITGVDPFEDG